MKIASSTFTDAAQAANVEAALRKQGYLLVNVTSAKQLKSREYMKSKAQGTAQSFDGLASITITWIEP